MHFSLWLSLSPKLSLPLCFTKRLRDIFRLKKAIPGLFSKISVSTTTIVFLSFLSAIHFALSCHWYKKEKVDLALLTIIAKYGVLIREWDGLYYALLEVSMNKIALWKNVLVDDRTAELAITASNVNQQEWNDPGWSKSENKHRRTNLRKFVEMDCVE